MLNPIQSSASRSINGIHCVQPMPLFLQTYMSNEMQPEYRNIIPSLQSMDCRLLPTVGKWKSHIHIYIYINCFSVRNNGGTSLAAQSLLTTNISTIAYNMATWPMSLLSLWVDPPPVLQRPSQIHALHLCHLQLSEVHLASMLPRKTTPMVVHLRMSTAKEVNQSNMLH